MGVFNVDEFLNRHKDVKDEDDISFGDEVEEATDDLDDEDQFIQYIEGLKF